MFNRSHVVWSNLVARCRRMRVSLDVDFELQASLNPLPVNINHARLVPNIDPA